MRYRAWRVADLKHRPVQGNHEGSGDSWQVELCSGCGERVWVRAGVARGRTVVCWRCPDKAAA